MGRETRSVASPQGGIRASGQWSLSGGVGFGLLLSCQRLDAPPWEEHDAASCWGDGNAIDCEIDDNAPRDGAVRFQVDVDGFADVYLLW